MNITAITTTMKKNTIAAIIMMRRARNITAAIIMMRTVKVITATIMTEKVRDIAIIMMTITNATTIITETENVHAAITTARVTIMAMNTV